jgi:ribosomal-protein-alanine N-acetyltransferase
MEQGDVSTVVAIDRLSFPTPWSATSYSYELKHNKTSFYYVLLRPEADETMPRQQPWYQLFKNSPKKKTPVIGYMGYRLRGPRAHISTIAVHPEWRGCGLGELLLLTALEKALAQDRSAVTLEVRASNRVAQHLYRKCGFRFTGVQPKYYRDGEDAWLMEMRADNRACRDRVSDLRAALETRLCQQHSRAPWTSS